MKVRKEQQKKEARETIKTGINLLQHSLAKEPVKLLEVATARKEKVESKQNAAMDLS